MTNIPADGLFANLSGTIQDSVAATQRALLEETSTPVIDERNLRVEVAALPLFRRSHGAALAQVVRVNVSNDEAALGPVEVSLSTRDGQEVDRAIVPAGKGRRTVDLEVPEVTVPTEFAVSVAGDRTRVVTVPRQRKWTIYLIHHSHLDIGYTDPQGVVLQNHLGYLDSLVDLTRATDDWPDDARFRWNVEAAWPLVRWLGARSDYSVNQMRARIREGRVEVHALPFNIHTEACSTDELYRLLRIAEMLRERYGMVISTAMQTDVPGCTQGLVDALTDAGVRYLTVAQNWAGRSVPFLTGDQDRQRPFYWQAPSGRQVLVWFTDTPHGMAYMEGNVLGLADGYERALTLLPAYLDALATRPYPLAPSIFGWPQCEPAAPVTKQPYPHDILHLRVQGAFADNAAPSIIPARIVRQWNEEWAYPRLRAAVSSEFFAEAEQRLAGRIPTYTGDWTDWWADGIGSGARALGYSRRAQSSVRAAQTLHSVADQITRTRTDTSADVDVIYDDLALFDEHTWGSANPWADAEAKAESGALQWARKSAFAYEGYDRAGALLEAASRRVGDGFSAHPGALSSLLVVNTSSRPRTDVVRVFLPESRVGSDTPITLIDARTDNTVPHMEQPPENAAHRRRGRYLKFVAHDVPGLGFARYDVIAGSETPTIEDLDRATTIETEHYRLTYDPMDCCIASIFDKRAGRELVNTDALAGFNQYLYDRYTTGSHVNHLSSRTVASPSLLGERAVGHHGTMIDAHRDATSVSLVVDFRGAGVHWLRTHIHLPRDVARIDITNRLDKTGSTDKESGFFCFPFKATEEPVAYEISGGVASPNGPVVPGAAAHMRAIRHWVALQDEDLGMAWASLEAPLVQFGNVHLPYAPFPPTLRLERPEPSTVYSWIYNNIWDTNFPPQQQGEMTFRYAIASAAGESSERLAADTAESLITPLIGVVATGTTPAPASAAFCLIDSEDVHVVSISPARGDHDIAVRLRSLNASTTRVRLQIPRALVRAGWVGSYLERRLTAISVAEDAVQVTVPALASIAVVLDLH